jgi:hypothetical protein
MSCDYYFQGYKEDERLYLASDWNIRCVYMEGFFLHAITGVAVLASLSKFFFVTFIYVLLLLVGNHQEQYSSIVKTCKLLLCVLFAWPGS